MHGIQVALRSGRGTKRARAASEGREEAAVRDDGPSMELEIGRPFPDLNLPDHTSRSRRLSDVAGGDPVALFFSRGWWCPKEQRYLRELTKVQDEFEVAYSRIAVVSVDQPEVQAAFRAGLGARFLFLSDAERRWIDRLNLRETTDTVHDPYVPTAFTLYPDLTIHTTYEGYWFWGRPTIEELRQDMRSITMAIRPDWRPM
jgi:peroxiredoxin